MATLINKFWKLLGDNKKKLFHLFAGRKLSLLVNFLTLYEGKKLLRIFVVHLLTYVGYLRQLCQ